MYELNRIGMFTFVSEKSSPSQFCVISKSLDNGIQMKNDIFDTVKLLTLGVIFVFFLKDIFILNSKLIVASVFTFIDIRSDRSR